MTITHEAVTYTGASEENWVAGGVEGKIYFSSQDQAALAPASYTDVGDIIADICDTVSFDYLYYNTTAGVSINTNGKIYTRLDASITTVEAWKTYLGTHNLQVCYALATPTTIQLTPAQLTMLKGYNYLSGDGTITITAYVKTT